MTTLLKHAAIVLSAALTLACAGEDADVATPASDAPAPAASEGDALDRLSGRWEVRAWSQAGDSLPTHILTAAADTAGWSVTFPDRPPIPVHVIDRSGDLVVFETAPYESVLRPGVRVSVLFVTRLNGDSSTGSLIAHYDVAGATAILRGRTEGTRQP